MQKWELKRVLKRKKNNTMKHITIPTQVDKNYDYQLTEFLGRKDVVIEHILQHGPMTTTFIYSEVVSRVDPFKLFTELPPVITHSGLEFHLQLFNNYGEARMCYILVDDKKLGWKNPFDNYKDQGFLWLFEGVDSIEEFRMAIKECYDFLKKNELF